MKFKTTITCLFFIADVVAKDDVTAERWGDFADPRQPIALVEVFNDGKKVADARNISHSILIIHWAPDPEGGFDTYQIGGVNGYHSREHVERFLHAFYKLEQPKEVGVGRLNVLVAGNNWGAGQLLYPTLVDLCKSHSFSVFFAGGWAFKKAALISEPKARLVMIQKAHQQATDSEQDGVDQPATAVDSKSEGSENTKP